MRLLINASTTAEGWEAYNTSSDRTKSFGIIPTQNASVVTTYTRFQKLIDESIPLLDGDAPGRSYITDLIALDNPPQTILNLGYDLELEDLISWIVQPQTVGRQTELETLLQPFNGRSLRDFLHDNKQHWGYQDSLADYILRTEDCVRRARLLVNSIYSIDNLEGDYAQLWQLDADRSTESISVYSFTYPNL